MSVKPFATAPGPLKGCDSPWSMITRTHACIDSAGEHSGHLLYTKNKNSSTVTKLGTCIVSLLIHLYVKYYTVKIFIVKCNLPIKPKTTHFDTYVYAYYFCLVKNSLLKFFQAFKYMLYYFSYVVHKLKQLYMPNFTVVHKIHFSSDCTITDLSVNSEGALADSRFTYWQYHLLKWYSVKG